MFLFLDLTMYGFQQKRKSEMEVASEIVAKKNEATDFMSLPQELWPIMCSSSCDRAKDHRPQLLLMWDDHGRLHVACVVSVWASCWARRTHLNVTGMKAKKPARHLVGFPVPIETVAKVRVAILEVDTVASEGGITYIARGETEMRISDHNNLQVVDNHHTL